MMACSLELFQAEAYDVPDTACTPEYLNVPGSFGLNKLL
jgi:hypothetical protein